MADIAPHGYFDGCTHIWPPDSRVFMIVSPIIRQVAAAQPIEEFEHRVEGGHGVRFETAQRAQSQRCEVGLKAAHIVLPHSKVVQQVARAGTEFRCGMPEYAGELLLERQCIGAQPFDCASGAYRQRSCRNVGIGALPLRGWRSAALLCR